VLYTCVLLKLFRKYFSALFPLFFQIFCVKCSDDIFGTSWRWSCMSGQFFRLSGRYGWFIHTFILLVRTSVFLWPLRGSTSGRHLSSVRTVNPVGLNRFLPAPQPICSPLLIRFCRLVTFLCAFCFCESLLYTCHLCSLSPLQVYFCSFWLIYFKFSMLKIGFFWVLLLWV
jgi:hypothetical protein